MTLNNTIGVVNFPTMTQQRAMPI